MSILQPPKIYLDTNHLIKISRLRKGRLESDKFKESYEFIDHCLNKRHFGLVFAPQISLEWVDGNATLESALEIAAVVDSAKLQYEVEADHFVFLYEVLTELRRIVLGIELPEFEVFYPRILGSEVVRPLGVLANGVPGYFEEGELPSDASELPEAIPFYSAAEHAKQVFTFRRKRQVAYNQRVTGHKAAYLQDVASFLERNKKKANRSDAIGWMQRFLRVDKILVAIDSQTDVESLLGQVVIHRCPAVNLFLKSHDKRVRAGVTPEENDVEDWASVHIVPYVDLFLTEKRLCHFICQADPSLSPRVTSDPNQAKDFLSQWT